MAALRARPLGASAPRVSMSRMVQWDYVLSTGELPSSRQFARTGGDGETRRGIEKRRSRGFDIRRASD